MKEELVQLHSKNQDISKIKYQSVNMRFVKFPLPGTMDIFKDKVLVVLWRSKPTDILITSNEIDDHFKRYFDSLWAFSSIVVMSIVMTIHAAMGA